MWVVEKRHEPEILVKLASGLVYGIDLDCADAKLFSKVLGSSQRIDQEKGAEPLTLYTTVDRQPPEQDDRHVDPRQAFRLVVGQVRVSYLVA